MNSFKEIRANAVYQWNIGLNRARNGDSFSDDYSESTLCKWQNECLAQDKHCSFLCSFGDWLNNLSDLLYDLRYDNLTDENWDVLFRYYTRILLLLSEVIEDIITMDKNINKFISKSEATTHISEDTFEIGELKSISDFINSVCKHKTEKNNLHVHNHHLKIEFMDFGSKEHENQIRLNSQNWGNINKKTTILISELSYFIGLIIKLNNRLDNLISRQDGYKDKLFELYTDDWKP